MKAQIDFLTQRAVESVRKSKNKKGYGIIFEDNSRLEVDFHKDAPDELPDIETLSLLKVVETEEEGHTLTFGRATSEGVSGEPIEVVIPTDAKYKVKMLGWDEEDRDLSIPPHPDEREASGLEEDS